MAQIQLMQPGMPVADFSVAGNLITIAGLAIDCAERQQDVTEIVEIRQQGTVVTEGGDGAYLAQIFIPPRQFAEAEEPGEGEEQADPIQLPLDPNAVLILLWPAI